MCDDKNSNTRCKNVALAFDNGSKGESILLPQWIQRHRKRHEHITRNFRWKLRAMWKTWKIVKKHLKVCLLITRKVSQCQVETYEQWSIHLMSYQFSIDNTSQVSFTSLSFNEVNGKCVGAQPSRCVGADEIDNELHLVKSLDYIMYLSTKKLKHSEMTFLQNQCYFKNTQMLTILM